MKFTFFIQETNPAVIMLPNQFLLSFISSSSQFSIFYFLPNTLSFSPNLQLLDLIKEVKKNEVQ